MKEKIFSMLVGIGLAVLLVLFGLCAGNAMHTGGLKGFCPASCVLCTKAPSLYEQEKAVATHTEHRVCGNRLCI